MHLQGQCIACKCFAGQGTPLYYLDLIGVTMPIIFSGLAHRHWALLT